ncbi:hypothetical protein [Microvirga puerhi]|uniref:Uncharacterized protein n=1 Tax=Microvirga puerhi TaxID=2876078 RepID=A0ABS7VIC7_9HYPH|nr:hypothetical protein [Microvirga puerhi]MBZ6075273.1 hypothetical protein [Microvirga puerhi]
MKQSPPDTYDWYDEDDALQPMAGVAGGALPGFLPSWQQLGWWTGGITFAALWVFESWSKTPSSIGREGIGRLAESVWGLLLALAICYGIYKFCVPRYPKLGHALCIISAIVLLLQHVA